MGDTILDAIIKLLNLRADLDGWSVRHVAERGAQLYAVPSGVEAKRAVDSQRYIIDVLRANQGPDGSQTCGTGNATILPGDDIQKAIDAASLMAGLVHNPPHGIPAPAPLAKVSLVDPWLQTDLASALDEVFARLEKVAGEQPHVRMTAAECFAQEEAIHLVNSRGIDASQVSTRIDIEWVFLSQKDGKEVESYVEMTRRRVADLNLEVEIQRRARYAVDLLQASAPPSTQGPVVLQGATLGGFVNSYVLSFLSSGEARFQKITPWEVGQPIFKGEVKGDSLSVWANRQLPYGTHSDCFDAEGVPAQRVALIQENKLAAFTANQRYADYLSIPVTGEFGNMELPAGTIPAQDLLTGSHIEVADFSWFNPDAVTGEFASEIRLGYVVDGDKRTHFKGGMLVGNLLDALADVRWSAEVGFYGNYQGPAVAHFANLKVTGK